jgi:Holliday junction resolvase RusA-like endonuclease
MTVSFFVHGIPGPAGSKRPIKHKHTGRIMLIDSGGERTKRWRDNVHLAAVQAMNGAPPIPAGTPITLAVEFFMPRPKCHFGSGRNAQRLKPDAPAFPVGKPDRTKLLRGTEDELTGIVWADDCAVVAGPTSKLYAADGVTGAKIVVEF